MDLSNWIDITPIVSKDTAVFPGDIPFSRNIQMDYAQGDHLTLSSISTTLHIGAHVDAPNHYNSSGKSIEERSLNYYMGDCQVIEVDISKGKRIQVADLKSKEIHSPRVLFKTNSFPSPEVWNDDFNALSVELVEYLQQKAVITIGIDTPSVDLANDKELLAHSQIAKYDMAILEGIILNNVSEGNYHLIALPLKLKGCDASPVRAVLIPKEDKND